MSNSKKNFWYWPYVACVALVWLGFMVRPEEWAGLASADEYERDGLAGGFRALQIMLFAAGLAALFLRSIRRKIAPGEFPPIETYSAPLTRSEIVFIPAIVLAAIAVRARLAVMPLEYSEYLWVYRLYKWGVGEVFAKCTPGCVTGLIAHFLLRSGLGMTWLRLPGVVFSSLTVLPVFFLARRIGGRFPAVAAAALTAASPALAREAAAFSPDDGVALMTALFLVCLLRFLEKPSIGRGVLTAATCTVATLFDLSAGYVIGGAYLGFLFTRPWRDGINPVAAFTRYSIFFAALIFPACFFYAPAWFRIKNALTDGGFAHFETDGLAYLFSAAGGALYLVVPAGIFAAVGWLGLPREKRGPAAFLVLPAAVFLLHTWIGAPHDEHGLRALFYLERPGRAGLVLLPFFFIFAAIGADVAGSFFARGHVMVAGFLRRTVLMVWLGALASGLIVYGDLPEQDLDGALTYVKRTMRPGDDCRAAGMASFAWWKFGYVKHVSTDEDIARAVGDTHGKLYVLLAFRDVAPCDLDFFNRIRPYAEVVEVFPARDPLKDVYVFRFDACELKEIFRPTSP